MKEKCETVQEFLLIVLFSLHNSLTTHTNLVRDWNRACIAYEQAAEYYDSEHFTTQSCVCLYKAGYILALLEKFDKAVEFFERVISSIHIY
jgi:tetratricopeptide (TPR) repeat protein